jgi:broad-specificity NMP kinase
VGKRNFMVEGVSRTGKTSVCNELRRQGYHAINGDTELAYQGDPETGAPTDRRTHEHHIWGVHRVQALVADHYDRLTFFAAALATFRSS